MIYNLQRGYAPRKRAKAKGKRVFERDVCCDFMQKSMRMTEAGTVYRRIALSPDNPRYSDVTMRSLMSPALIR